MNVIKKYGLMWWAIGATLLAIIFINAYIFGVAMRNLSNEPYLYAKTIYHETKRDFTYVSNNETIQYNYYLIHAWKMEDPKTVDYDENGYYQPIIFTITQDNEVYNDIKENGAIFRVIMYKESNINNIKFWSETN